VERQGKILQAAVSGERISPSPEAKATEWTVDLELIRWSLSLTEEERLAVLQDFVDTFWTPQHG